MSDWDVRAFEIALGTESEAVQKLEELIALRRNSATEVISDLIAKVDGRSNSWICVYLVNKLRELTNGEFEEALCRVWHSAGDIQRGNIAISILSSPTISTQNALRLFYDSASTVHDRHRIAAALAKALRDHSPGDIVLDLLNKIGRYDDPKEQEALDRFTISVKKAFITK